MSYHVFAVWDFMSLLKSLQRSLTCVSVPWLPSNTPSNVRLINEIVLEEESDLDPNGNPCSHLDLYMEAMRDVGASTNDIDLFLGQLMQGESYQSALEKITVPSFVSNFVRFSLDTALNAELCEVGAAFVFGRETVIPMMFKNLILEWNVDEKSVQAMHYYLKRHIDLDGDEHGPASLKLLNNLIAGDPCKTDKVIDYSRRAIGERIKFWDGLYLLIKARSPVDRRFVA